MLVLFFYFRNPYILTDFYIICISIKIIIAKHRLLSISSNVFYETKVSQCLFLYIYV